MSPENATRRSAARACSSITSINEIITAAEAEAVAGLPGNRQELLVASCHDRDTID